MEVYTVKLSGQELTQMRVALALANKKIVSEIDKAHKEGRKTRMLELEIMRLQNNNCHMALEAATREDLDKG